MSDCQNADLLGTKERGDMDTLMTPDEVAELLRVSSRTVYRWMEDGRLPGVVTLPGRLRRVSRTRLEAWLAGQAGDQSGDQPRDQRLTVIPAP